MAIVQEHFFIGEREFIRTYSDTGMMVHGGEPDDDYSEANDPAEFNRQYTETNIPIDGDSELADKAEAYDILMGVSE